MQKKPFNHERYTISSFHLHFPYVRTCTVFIHSKVMEQVQSFHWSSVYIAFVWHDVAWYTLFNFTHIFISKNRFDCDLYIYALGMFLHVKWWAFFFFCFFCCWKTQYLMNVSSIKAESFLSVYSLSFSHFLHFSWLCQYRNRFLIKAKIA